jgi:acetylornithine deacetylase
MAASSDLQAAVDRWVDDHAEDVLQLTEALIRFPSENHAPIGYEKECQLFVTETMRGLNLEMDIFEPTDVPGLVDHPAYWPGRDYRERPNVVGTWRGTESGNGRSLIFSSHVDVVAGSKGGRFPPFEPTREASSGKLYGRGSNDMKGGLAASIVAVRCLQALGVRLRGDVIVESVVDEEMGGSNGTLAARLRGHNADACIVPEPNGMFVSPAHRGGCMWEISLEGSPGMPFGSTGLEAARNQYVPTHPLYQAIPGLPVVLSRVAAGDFEPGSGNGVPGRALLEAWAEVYPGTSFEDLSNDFLGNLKQVAARTPVIQQCEMKVHQVTRFLPGSEIPNDHPIVQAVSRAYAQVAGREPELRGAPFACDVYVFNLHSPTPCVILGPRGANAHAPDEWVMMEDLVALTKIFALTAAEWCA